MFTYKCNCNNRRTEEREQDTHKYLKKKWPNFSKFDEIEICNINVKLTPNKINTNKAMPRHRTWLRIKEKEPMWSVKGKITYRKAMIWIMVELLETMEARKQRNNFVKTLKEKLSIRNFISRKNIIQEWKQNKDILR